MIKSFKTKDIQVFWCIGIPKDRSAYRDHNFYPRSREFRSYKAMERASLKMKNDPKIDYVEHWTQIIWIQINKR